MGRIVDVAQGSDEWHSFRRLGLGGSDAPVVEGLSPYRTKRQLFFEKSGVKVDCDEGEENEYIFNKGHKVEGLIRKEFQDLVRVEMNPVCMIHDSHDYIRASLDGFHPSLGVLEAKLVGQDVLKAARAGEIPAHHMSQIQHQLSVTGADVAQWFGHDGKKSGVLVEVRANSEYIKKLLDLEHAFWFDIKEGRVPDLSERDYLVPEDSSLLTRLREAKELAENAALEYESLKELVVNTYGGHPRIAGAGVKLFKVNRQGSISWSTIPEIKKAVEEIKNSLAPEYVEQFRGSGSESWNIRIS